MLPAFLFVRFRDDVLFLILIESFLKSKVPLVFGNLRRRTADIRLCYQFFELTLNNGK